MPRPIALLAALLLASPAAAFEYPDALESSGDPAPEHGKAATADASPVDVGAIEAELGYGGAWNNHGGSRGFDVAAPGHSHAFAGTVTYGAAANVDVKVSAGFANVYDSAHLHDDGSAPKRGLGATDATFGARWRFLNLSEQALEVAFIGDVVMPIGARHSADAVGLTQDFWSARGALVATKDFGALTMNTEVALSAPVSGDAGGFRSATQLNAAVGYQLASWFQPEVELNYTRTASFGPTAQVLAVTAGVVAPFGAGHRVVAAVQQGAWGANTTRTTSAVLSFKTSL